MTRSPSLSVATSAPRLAAVARPRIVRGASSNRRGSRLTNISTQAFVSPTSGPIIVGFNLSGSGPTRVLLRAAGPALAEFGLRGWLNHPRIQLFNREGTRILENDEAGWERDNIPGWTQRVNAFPFRPGSRDAALVTTLAPGPYTAHISSYSSSACGVSVVEVFEIADPDQAPGGGRLTNLSTLGHISPREGPLLTRLSVFGKTPRRFLIRGVGPGLADYGVVDPIADPQVDLYASSALIGSNGCGSAANSGKMSATSAECGAFSLQNSGRDTALLVTLNRGSHTVVLRSASGSTGRGLIEIYEVPERW